MVRCFSPGKKPPRPPASSFGRSSECSKTSALWLVEAFISGERITGIARLDAIEVDLSARSLEAGGLTDFYISAER